MQSEHLEYILKAVHRLEIQSKQLASGALSGAYHSLFKGQGMHFEEVRAYCAGDDVRCIDWNVTARTGDPFIKLFREDRERTVILLLDLSASTRYGSSFYSKREYLASITGILAFLSLKAGDRIGLLLFTEDVEYYIPPKRGLSHTLRIIREALFFEPKNKKTHIQSAFLYLNRLLKRRSVLFLLTDSLSVASAEQMEMLRLTRIRHQLHVLLVEDPREQTIPDSGLVTLKDAETGACYQIDTSNPTYQKLYRATHAQRTQSLTQAFRKMNIPLAFFSTPNDCVAGLKKLLALS